LRSRFFWTILGVLAAVVIGTTLLHQSILKQERLDLIDQQMRETAAALMDSELNGLRKVELDKVEAILSEELGESRIGKFFVIRNSKNEILFESNSAKLLPIDDIPNSPQWVSILGKGQFIRILNLQLPRVPDRTLQVGLVLDDDLYAPNFFSKSNLTFCGFILLVGFSIAWLLASNLVKPITRLSEFVSGIAQNKDDSLELPPLPAELRRYFEQDSNSKDELNILLSSFEKMIARVNKGYQLSRFWSYQMAHELKTPLTIIDSIATEAVKENKLDAQVSQNIMTEVFEASETITSFLNWAEAENNSANRRLHVVKMSRVLGNIENRLAHRYGERIQFQVVSDFTLMANLEQLEQLISNLIVNACHYSPENSPVTVLADNRKLAIIDEGAGIPESVQKKLGQPFNKGENSKKGSGLGLAFAESICRLYEWNFKIAQSNSLGTRIEIEFPEVTNAN
jgi:Signal transduction histidine kinase